jgi:hypothetical protein
MALSTNRPGYAQIEALSHLASDSADWWPFVRDVLNLPFSMLPAVRYAVKAGGWRIAKDPVGQLKNAAENHARRRALSGKPTEEKAK